MKNIFLALCVAVILSLVVWVSYIAPHPAPIPDTASNAASSSYDPLNLLMGAGSSKTGTNTDNGASAVSCNLSVNLVTNADGSQQAQFTYQFPDGATGVIDNGTGEVPASGGTAVKTLSPILTQPTTYVLKVYSGTATTSCTVSATPTSFATPAQ